MQPPEPGAVPSPEPGAVPSPEPGSAPAPGPLEADRLALRARQRVSPFGPLFMAWGFVRRVGFLNVGVFTAVIGSRNIQLFGLLASIGLFAVGFAQWFRFTYWLETTDEGDQLVTTAGVLQRTRTSVPLDRVQAVSTRQNLLHRMCNLVEVSVQTAGSAGAEVQLSAVGPHVADRLRRLTTATRTSGSVARVHGDHAPEPAAQNAGDGPAHAAATLGAPPPTSSPASLPALTGPTGPTGSTGLVAPMPPGSTPVLRRSTTDILRVALTRNPLVLLAPIPLVAALLPEAGELLGPAGDTVTDRVEEVGASVAGIIALVLIGVLLSVAVSVVFMVVRLYDLRVFTDGAGLRRLAGLINRTEVTASVERVQVVAAKQNPLERLASHHEVVLPLAGSSGQPAQGVQGTSAAPNSLQLPGTRDAELEHVESLIFGRAHGAESGHAARPISPLAARRWTMWIGAVPAGIAALVGWFVIGPWALFALLWPVAVMPVAGRYRQAWTWSVGAETLRIASGVVTRTRRTMAVRKVQNVQVRQGIFHRRNGLADVRVRTASRVAMTVPMLPLATAHALRDELLFRSESDPRPFM